MAGELISGEVMDAATQRKGIKEKFIKSLFKLRSQHRVVKASPNVRRRSAKIIGKLAPDSSPSLDHVIGAGWNIPQQPKQ